MNTNKSNTLLIVIAIIIGCILIGGAIVWSSKHPSTTGTTGTTGTAPATVDVSKIATDGYPFIGQADAPVTIVAWTDYQCPFCKAWEVGGVQGIDTPAALPDIIQNYVNDGKVKVVFKDFAFLGNDSITGAEYAHAVWKLYPAQYFAWRTAMYKAQDEEGDQGFGNAASIDKLDATISGIDAAKVTADVNANKATYDADIAAQKTEAQALGVQATPSFAIGDGNPIIAGAYPYATFQQAIDAALSAAGATN